MVRSRSIRRCRHSYNSFAATCSLIMLLGVWNTKSRQHLATGFVAICQQRRTIRPTAAWMEQSPLNNNDDAVPSIPSPQKKKNSKEKRREFIGMAKAVDRGQWSNIYQPWDGQAYAAKSGLPDRTQEFIVLGIESSCDDTGAAVLSSNGTILGEALASQSDIHEPFGGVVPNLAKQAHMDAMDGVVQDALDSAGVTMEQIHAIGVTVGPGLEICLRVGTNKAKALALQYHIPFVGVHHLEAHILMARLPLDPDITRKIAATETTHATTRALEFPFLALLVSGGHCLLLKCVGVGQYTTIGGTIDDSLGEAFDKTARLLGLPIGGGGGPAVEKLAKDGDPKSIPLTIPMQKHKNCDFSYAGLKTNIRRAAEKMAAEQELSSVDQLPYQDKANLAASFQHVAIVHIEQRLIRAMMLMQDESSISTLVVVGGVAANQELRSRLNQLCAERKWDMHVPPPRLCTDQGAMSAWAAIERLTVGSSDEPEGHEVYARYPFWTKPSTPAVEANIL